MNKGKLQPRIPGGDGTSFTVHGGGRYNKDVGTGPAAELDNAQRAVSAHMAAERMLKPRSRHSRSKIDRAARTGGSYLHPPVPVSGTRHWAYYTHQAYIPDDVLSEVISRYDQAREDECVAAGDTAMDLHKRASSRFLRSLRSREEKEHHKTCQYADTYDCALMAALQEAEKRPTKLHQSDVREVICAYFAVETARDVLTADEFDKLLRQPIHTAAHGTVTVEDLYNTYSIGYYGGEALYPETDADRAQAAEEATNRLARMQEEMLEELRHQSRMDAIRFD